MYTYTEVRCTRIWKVRCTRIYGIRLDVHVYGRLDVHVYEVRFTYRRLVHTYMEG